MGTPFKRIVHALTVSAVLASFAPAMVVGQRPTTSDVDFTARLILAQLDEIGWYMGRTVDEAATVSIDDVSVHESFAQARSLWRKVNQLGVELVGGGESPPIITLPRGMEYGPPQVQLVLESVLDRLAEVREGVGVVGAVGALDEAPVSTTEIEKNDRATATDVFRTVVRANRLADGLLERGAQSGDVFQQVQQAAFFASEILTALDDPTPLPAAPEYEAGVTSGEVCDRLMLAFGELSEVFEIADLDIMRWSFDGSLASVTPGDAYLVATQLVAELEYLSERIPGARAPMRVEHPGQRWPSDVYQQASVVADQLSRIRHHATENPDFLQRPAR